MNPQLTWDGVVLVLEQLERWLATDGAGRPTPTCPDAHAATATLETEADAWVRDWMTQPQPPALHPELQWLLFARARFALASARAIERTRPFANSAEAGQATLLLLVDHWPQMKRHWLAQRPPGTAFAA